MNANKAGKLTITLQQESPDIPYLEQCAEKSVLFSIAFYLLSERRTEDALGFDLMDGTAQQCLPGDVGGQRNQLNENHVNYLTEEYKRQYVKEGVCLNGEFIDVVLGGDWIAKRMRDLLYDILLENANIDYSDAGFGLIATAVLQALAPSSASVGSLASANFARVLTNSGSSRSVRK